MACVLACAMLIGASRVHAQDALAGGWLQLGATDHRLGDAALVGAASYGWDSFGTRNWRFYPEVIAGAVGPRSGNARYATRSVPFAGGGLRIAYREWPVFLSVAPVYNSHYNQNIGGHLNFFSELGLRFDNLTLGLGHISNNDLNKPNRGENMLLLGWMFR